MSRGQGAHPREASRSKKAPPRPFLSVQARIGDRGSRPKKASESGALTPLKRLKPGSLWGSSNGSL